MRIIVNGISAEVQSHDVIISGMISNSKGNMVYFQQWRGDKLISYIEEVV